jgi:hypothetical protein
MRGRLITAAALVAIGLVWIGQGLGLLRTSGFMDGELFWAAAGALFVVGGSILGFIAWRSRPPV